jgi:hypothetical protein
MVWHRQRAFESCSGVSTSRPQLSPRSAKRDAENALVAVAARTLTIAVCTSTSTLYRMEIGVVESALYTREAHEKIVTETIGGSSWNKGNFSTCYILHKYVHVSTYMNSYKKPFKVGF